MKKLLTYLTLILCLSASAQSQKIIELQKQLIEVDTEWMSYVDANLRSLKTEVNNLKSQIETLKKGIDLNELIQGLQLKAFSNKNELPTDLAPDEIGIAFVKSKNEEIELYISINNQWSILKL